MSTHDLDWYELDGELGDAGLPGAGLPNEGWTTSVENRLTMQEAKVIPTVLSNLTDVDTTGRAIGDLLQWSGTAWVPYTPQPITISFAILIPLDGAGSAIPDAANKSRPVMPFAATITGWVLDADATSSAVIRVERAPNATPSTWTAISGTEKPTLSSAQSASDTNLTTWTTAITAMDRIRAVKESGNAEFVNLTLLCTRQVGP